MDGEGPYTIWAFGLALCFDISLYASGSHGDREEIKPF